MSVAAHDCAHGTGELGETDLFFWCHAPIFKNQIA